MITDVGAPRRTPPPRPLDGHPGRRLGLQNARGLIRDGELLIVDGMRGVVIVNRISAILEPDQLRKQQIELEKVQAQAHLNTAKSEQTIDGVEVQLFANIESAGDVPQALQHAPKASAVCTELLF